MKAPVVFQLQRRKTLTASKLEKHNAFRSEREGESVGITPRNVLKIRQMSDLFERSNVLHLNIKKDFETQIKKLKGQIIVAEESEVQSKQEINKLNDLLKEQDMLIIKIQKDFENEITKLKKQNVVAEKRKMQSKQGVIEWLGEKETLHNKMKDDFDV